MNTRLTIWLAALLLMSLSVFCNAQEAPRGLTPGLTPEQQAALDQRDQNVSQAALNIVRFIDGDKIGEIWDTASQMGKKIISRDDFIKKIAQERSALGTPGMRMPMGLKHLHFDGTGNLPAGAFINVAFDTQFSNV
jgi:hypothetical protein